MLNKLHIRDNIDKIAIDYYKNFNNIMLRENSSQELLIYLMNIFKTNVFMVKLNNNSTSMYINYNIIIDAEELLLLDFVKNLDIYVKIFNRNVLINSIL